MWTISLGMIALAVVVLLVAVPDGAAAEDQMLFDFDQASDALGWRTINDTVMGGVSNSAMATTGEGSAVFSGYLSLDNYGGFASVRSRARLHDLSAYQGLALRVRGDGKRYTLSLKLDSALDGIMYQAPFQTVAGEWTEVRLPFASCCAPVFRGRQVPDTPPLDASKIMQFGLMIAEKQEGPFRLEIDWIRAYGE